MRTLVLGGIHSGKSAHAEHLIATALAETGAQRVRYVATAATPPTGDPEWSRRIDRHRRRRPASWSTVETSDLAGELRTEPSVPTLVDDLGNWVSTTVDGLGGWDDLDLDIGAQIASVADAVAAFSGELVLVSPEVGLSLVAPTPAGRRFQQDLGSLNAAVAQVCDRVVLVVAGRVIELTGRAEQQLVLADRARTAQGPLTPSPAPAPEATTSESLTPEPTPAAAATAPSVSAKSAAPTAVARVGDHHRAPDEFDVIVSPDSAVAQQARQRQAQLTKPAGSLGRLEEISIWAASCQGACPPAPFANPTVVVFAGDHGVAAAGVSAYPPEVTAQMVGAVAAGGAAVSVLARQVGAQVRVEDLAVDADTPAELSRFKVRRGSGDLRVQDALSADEVRAAVANGRAIADELVDAGADLVIAGDLGIGNTTPAAVLVGVLTDTEPVVVVGRGTGIDDAGWIRKTAAIRDGMRRGRAVVRSPLDLLAAVAGADLAAMAGFLAQAASRRTPVILDGVVVTAAALVAEDLAPGAAQWWLAGHRSAEPAHSIALRQLGLDPVLEFDMRLGEGSGAVLALPVVQAAVATLGSMSTFAEAGVSEQDATAVVDA
ncbi:nicotinate-nucleotide--dimethylbenzimidazole phosphoribosyltransferase [Williamsia sp. CHRR-6]|uniref:nicotinate-nucleotide--dimethylbenzimidazole phosphoribosyltransferase n=1 Tax=Williamsia sp. CHRR-6 TaxID=2835871 RepID=UPI001BDA6C8E|nr:nicotinate-nucleotide--dimethylbenzimidazole phosphoribosyltransferase [Williamsia sp. CHRR-6]MBT0565313.1 nicotinate-nucleotide--dimethylbenzimidazole phosphoribosyltransferase [Williamsia sp. CHRR-6]